MSDIALMPGLGVADCDDGQRRTLLGCRLVVVVHEGWGVVVGIG